MRSKSQILLAAMLTAVLMGSSVAQEAGTAMDAGSLLPTSVIDRLAERSAPRVADGVMAPGFIVDPSWPKPLPNDWRIGHFGAYGQNPVDDPEGTDIDPDDAGPWAADYSDGNIYTGEVDTGQRIQRFVRYGNAGCGGSGTADIGLYSLNR